VTTPLAPRPCVWIILKSVQGDSLRTRIRLSMSLVADFSSGRDKVLWQQTLGSWLPAKGRGP
jgi:hypothetical protein